MTQTDMVLDELKRAPITQIEAYERVGTTRLAAYIHVLREQGHNIRTEDVTKGNKTFARYHLIRS